MISTILAACDPNAAFGVDCISDLEGQLPNYKFAGKNLNYLISFQTYGVVNIIFFLAGVALIINLILAGIGLMTSAGDPAKIKGGQERIKNGLLGMLLIFSAYIIIQIIAVIFNLPGLKATFLL